MPSPWCSSPSEGGRPAPLVALLLAVLVWVAIAPPAPAATILEKSVRHRVEADGSVLESSVLRVHLDRPSDLDDWNPYPIYLDDHRRLESIDTFATTPEGERVVVKKKEHDTAEHPGAGILAGSQRYRLVEFPRLPAGSVLHLAWTVREEPYFPGGAIALGEDEPVATLRVEVTGPPDLRVHLDSRSGPWGEGALRLERSAGRVEVVGEGLPAPEIPALAPGGTASKPVLRYSWGPAESWSDVADWYRSYLESLPPSAEVSTVARQLTEGLPTPRERLEALLAYAREKVRYVAVEMGIGGFKPSPTSETVERGWGDCKDKATLLAEMLGAVGLEAHPALVLSADDRRIDPAFPSPHQFNHAIVAVPLDGQDLEPGEGDPVAGGYLFLDPTDDDGSSHWLHAGVQDQDALVVAEGSSELVRTPGLFSRDVRDLRVDLDLATDGGASGRVELVLEGRFGDAFRGLLARTDTDRVEETVRRILGRLVPAAELTGIGWGEDFRDGAPSARLSARVTVPALVQSRGDRHSLRLGGIQATPDPADLLPPDPEEAEEAEGAAAARTLPLVLSPGVVTERWRLGLPEGACPPQTKVRETTTEVGSFVQTVGGEDGALVVARRLELPHRWLEPEQAGAVRELALAESRAHRRRVRFGGCGEEGAEDGTAP